MAITKVGSNVIGQYAKKVGKGVLKGTGAVLRPTGKWVYKGVSKGLSSYGGLLHKHPMGTATGTVAAGYLYNKNKDDLKVKLHHINPDSVGTYKPTALDMLVSNPRIKTLPGYRQSITDNNPYI